MDFMISLKWSSVMDMGISTRRNLKPERGWRYVRTLLYNNIRHAYSIDSPHNNIFTPLTIIATSICNSSIRILLPQDKFDHPYTLVDLTHTFFLLS